MDWACLAICFVLFCFSLLASLLFPSVSLTPGPVWEAWNCHQPCFFSYIHRRKVGKVTYSNHCRIGFVCVTCLYWSESSSHAWGPLSTCALPSWVGLQWSATVVAAHSVSHWRGPRLPIPCPVPSMQFAKDLLLVKEKEGVLHVPVVRSGDLSYESSVRCYTQSHSAQVMEDFEERRDADSSRITFLKGEKVSERMVANSDVLSL